MCKIFAIHEDNSGILGTHSVTRVMEKLLLITSMKLSSKFKIMFLTHIQTFWSMQKSCLTLKFGASKAHPYTLLVVEFDAFGHFSECTGRVLRSCPVF